MGCIMNRDVYNDVFCIDCNGYRKQKLKGRNSYDGTLLYVCTECGCENLEQTENVNIINLFSGNVKQGTMKPWKL